MFFWPFVCCFQVDRAWLSPSFPAGSEKNNAETYFFHKCRNLKREKRQEWVTRMRTTPMKFTKKLEARAWERLVYYYVVYENYSDEVHQEAMPLPWEKAWWFVVVCTLTSLRFVCSGPRAHLALFWIMGTWPHMARPAASFIPSKIADPHAVSSVYQTLMLSLAYTLYLSSISILCNLL